MKVREFSLLPSIWSPYETRCFIPLEALLSVVSNDNGPCACHAITNNIINMVKII